MKRVLSLILSLSMLFSVPFFVHAEEINFENNPIKNQIEVVEINNNHELVYYDGMVIEDFTTDKYRKIITKSSTDTSVYYEDLSTGIATLSVNGLIVETYDMNQLRNDYYTWNMPEEDKVLLEACLSKQIGNNHITLPVELQDKYMITYKNTGAVIISPAPNATTYSVRAANEIVRPTGPVTDTYPEYIYKEVDSSSQYSSYCDRYLDMTIKDSMYSYSQTRKQSYKYAAGTAISVISGALKIASSTLIGSLAGLTTVVSGILKLSSSIEYYFSESYMFYALRQTYIYDYTNYYRDVRVRSEYGTGEISLSWNFVNNEYINPHYTITGIAYPHTISYETMYENALDTWEYNMREHGRWIWGDV